MNEQPLTPDVHAKQQAQEKRKSFWMTFRFVSGVFFGTLVVALLSNAYGEPWAGVSYRDRQGDLVTEPDWSFALTVSLILSGVVAGLALWGCLTAEKQKKE